MKRPTVVTRGHHEVGVGPLELPGNPAQLLGPHARRGDDCDGVRAAGPHCAHDQVDVAEQADARVAQLAPGRGVVDDLGRHARPYDVHACVVVTTPERGEVGDRLPVADEQHRGHRAPAGAHAAQVLARRVTPLVRAVQPDDSHPGERDRDAQSRGRFDVGTPPGYPKSHQEGHCDRGGRGE
jgi:hypothetical protein